MDMDVQKAAQGDFAALLCALSFATGLGFGGHMEHGLRSASLGLHIADALALANEEREALFYGALLKDVACTACAAGMAALLPDEEQVSLADVILLDPSQFSDIVGWLSRYIRPDAHFFRRMTKLLSFLVQCKPMIREIMRGHCEVAVLFARQLGFADYVQQALRYQWERWDGKGMAYQVKGSAIPKAARILHLVQVIELMYHFAGPEGTRNLAQDKRGTRFDPEVVDAFLALAQSADFWDSVKELSTQETLLARCPATSAGSTQGNHAELVCEALADIVDLKTSETLHHSRTVAEIATKMGTALNMTASELSRLKCAALVHDVGKVAIPANILTKGERRSSSEWEVFRLHPYYTQRILGQTPVLQDLAQAAAAHHEWINGQGYHQQLCGEQIPFHGRMLAVADTYAKLVQQMSSAEALHQMRSQIGTQFERVCYEALVTATTGKERLTCNLPGTPHMSTLTKREMEVLSLLAQGCNTPQIARTLHISRKTVEHHLSHIYAKLGVTSRIAAVTSAIQQRLV